MHPLILKFAPYVALAIMTILYLGKRDDYAEVQIKLKNQANQTQEAADANVTNLVTINSLRARIDAMIAARKADQEARERLLAARDRELSIARLDAAKAKQERDRLLRSTESCENYADIVVADICPAIAIGLRERSRGPGSDGDKDSDGAGGSL